MILEVYRADHPEDPGRDGASYDKHFALAGYLWKGGHPDAQAALLEVARSEFKSFVELRNFVRWYEDLYCSHRRETETRLRSYRRFRRLGI